LLEAYQQINQNLPLFGRYAGLFRENTHVAKILASTYIDILEFHKRAFVCFRSKCKLSLLEIENISVLMKRLVWKVLFQAKWREVQKDITFILSSLYNRGLIETQAQLDEMELIRRLHASQEKEFLEAAEAERKAQTNSILTKDSPASVEVDQEKGAKIWQKAPFFGN